MDPDMNKYDVEHVCTGHPRMSGEEWNQDLSRRLEALLHRRACRDGAQARRRHRAQDEQDCRRDDGLLLRRADRGRPPAAMRHRPPQGEDDPPARDADRQSADFLSRPGGRVRVRGRAMADRRVALSPDQEARSSQDPASKTYVDDATRPVSIEEAENDELVMFFADKIPDTYGAPKRQPAIAS